MLMLAERHASTCHVARAACIEVQHMKPVAGAPDEEKQLEQVLQQHGDVAEHARDEGAPAESGGRRAVATLHRTLRSHHAERILPG